PAGLEVVDTRDWSVRTLDPEADSAVVADGILLADGSSWRSDANGSSGDGVAAYGADGTLRWRVDAGSPRWVAAAYGRLAVVGGESRPYELVDLATGKVLRTLAAQ